MRYLLVLCLGVAGLFGAMAADVTMPVLKVGSEVYSNVTVISTNATHLTFSHSRGMMSVKLKNLSPDLQKKFHYDGAKASEAEAKQHEADSQFRVQTAAKVAALKSAATNRPSTEDVKPPRLDENGDLVLETIYARSFRGERPPQIVVDKWVTSSPAGVEGKFVLVNFWATWCPPAVRTLPHLNQLQAKFRDKLVVISLSDESVEDILKMTSPPISHYVGTDAQVRTRTMLEVRALPHSIMMDPKGIVRYEGVPDYLSDEAMEHLIKEYSE